MSKHQTLEQLLHQHVSAFIESDKPQEIIDRHVEKMFESVVEDAFRYYGDTSKAVKEAFTQAMPGNIGDMLGLSRYNQMITNALRETWESSGISDRVVKQAQQAAEEVLKEYEIPETVSLKALMKAFIEEHAEEAHQSGWEHPKVVCEEEGSFFHLYFDKDPEESSRYTERSKYALDNNLAARIETNNDPNYGGHSVARVYSAKLDGDHLGKDHFRGRGDYDKLMFAIYYGEAKLILDCDPEDLYYPGYD